MNSKERIDYLVEILNKANYEYHVLDNPSITDQEFDKYLRELILLEEEYPELVRSDSPTSRVGGEVLDGFEKITHEIPMLSLSNVFNESEILAFDNRIKKDGVESEYTVEYKFDGLTICLTYDDGKFVCASTRGNGIEGEDVSAQVLTIKSFPLCIDFKGKLEVQGEAIIRLSVLEKYNQTATEILKNARNAVAGAIRNLDPKVTEKRHAEIMFYNVNYIEGKEFSSQVESVEFLKQNGFKVHPFLRVCDSIESVMSAIKDIEINRKTLDILTDGAVVKLNDMQKREKLGNTDKFPRWAIAFKFEAEETTTILTDVKWQVGRTGKLTPLGILEPTELAGATVKKATLNNYSDIQRKGVMIGARVLVRRSNEVIPEILGTTEVFDDSKVVERPTICPYCKSGLVETGANLFCPNKNCRPRVVAKLVNFASKNGFDIEGFSEMTAGLLFDQFGTNSFSDLFSLDKEQLLTLEGFKDAKASNLLTSIENSKNIDFDKFIYSLGIENVGRKTARDLSKAFKDYTELKNADYEKLISLSDVGEIMAEGIIKYFADSENLQEIEKLFELGVNIKYQTTEKKGVFSGEKVVLTGTLVDFKRDQAGKIITELGGEVQSSVSKTTTMVLAGENAGSKLDKAKKLGIKIIDEDTFKVLIKTW